MLLGPVASQDMEVPASSDIRRAVFTRHARTTLGLPWPQECGCALCPGSALLVMEALGLLVGFRGCDACVARFVGTI